MSRYSISRGGGIYGDFWIAFRQFWHREFCDFSAIIAAIVHKRLEAPVFDIVAPQISSSHFYNSDFVVAFNTVAGQKY